MPQLQPHPLVDLSVLESDPAVIFVLDRQLRIRYCNSAWNRFALANGGPSLLSNAVCGRAVTDFISGTLATDYRATYEKALERGVAWVHDYECSSATCIRRFTMHVYPLEAGSGLVVTNALRVEMPREASSQACLQSDYRLANGMIVMCSNCRRTKSKGLEQTWDWVPQFVTDPPDMVSHGLCPICCEHYHMSFERI